jgi:hypothetical protein
MNTENNKIKIERTAIISLISSIIAWGLIFLPEGIAEELGGIILMKIGIALIIFLPLIAFISSLVALKRIAYDKHLIGKTYAVLGFMLGGLFLFMITIPMLVYAFLR